MPLTRNEFYLLAEECRAHALDYARHDPSQVSLRHCHEFNAWLPRLQRYDLLAASLRTVRPARPIARWQIMTLGAVIGVIALAALHARVDRSLSSALIYGYFLVLLLVYFLPQRLYGTTIELLEGKLLRVVETMEAILLSGQLEFSEAAFFRVKQNLQDARQELRQQIDLAHRRWR